jgi:hypothetical protein
MAFELRTVECVIVAFVVLRAADTLRAELGLLWQTLCLLINN